MRRGWQRSCDWIGIPARYRALTAVPVAESVAPLPTRFRVLTYLPAPRRGFYGEKRVYALAVSMPAIKILVIGNGEPDPAAPPNVRFCGHVQDAGELIDAATILVRLPEHDGTSLMVLEALARGQLRSMDSQISGRPCGCRRRGGAARPAGTLSRSPRGIAASKSRRAAVRSRQLCAGNRCASVPRRTRPIGSRRMISPLSVNEWVRFDAKHPAPTFFARPAWSLAISQVHRHLQPFPVCVPDPEGDLLIPLMRAAGEESAGTISSPCRAADIPARYGTTDP